MMIEHAEENDIELDARLLSPEAIRHNTHLAMKETEDTGGFAIFAGTILHYLKFAVLVIDVTADEDDDDATVTLLHPSGRVEQVRYEVLGVLHESGSVHIGCDDAFDIFFYATGLKNEPPPTNDEASHQRMILRKLAMMIGRPSDWDSLRDEDYPNLDHFKPTIGDLKELWAALGDRSAFDDAPAGKPN